MAVDRGVMGDERTWTVSICRSHNAPLFQPHNGCTCNPKGTMMGADRVEVSPVPSGPGGPSEEAITAAANVTALIPPGIEGHAAAVYADAWTHVREMLQAAYAIDGLPAPVGDGEVEAREGDSVWLSEPCDGCGKPVRFGWAATAEHWNKIVGQYEGHLCIPCFTERSWAAGVTCLWHAIDSDADEERDYTARREVLVLRSRLEKAEEALRAIGEAGQADHATASWMRDVAQGYFRPSHPEEEK